MVKPVIIYVKDNMVSNKKYMLKLSFIDGITYYTKATLISNKNI